MADERFKSLTTPSLRRHSTGKPSLKTKDYVPNYLRASTGSCHDLCKYGKHVAEETRVVPEKKKRATLAKSKPLPISRPRLPGGPDTSKAIKLQVSSSDRAWLSLKSTSKAEDSNISAKRGPSMMKPLRSSEAARSNRVAVKKIVAAPVVGSTKPRKQWNLEIFSPHDNESKIMKSVVKQHDQDEVQEKILYVITKETENPPSESDLNDDCENKACGFDQYETFGAELSPPSPSTEEEDNQSLEYREMAKKVHSEDTIEHEKLSFRKGKVVEIQSEDHDGPMRLKFRRGRSMEENQMVKVNAMTKSFKPREAEAEAETNGGEAGSEQVVLRHQDVEQKKEAKGLLLNNVIEETASKLGGMQKSKVKALVGAFETVISLQDPKPLATTTVN